MKASVDLEYSRREPLPLSSAAAAAEKAKTGGVVAGLSNIEPRFSLEASSFLL